jgi:superfamily II DNA or RNA helicase
MFQWVDVLKKSYPNNKINTFYGINKGDGDIVVGIINSLLLQPLSFFKDYGYVILDEVHEYCSNTRKKIYQMAQSTYMLGLSATPDERPDGLDKVNIWQCGDILNANKLKGYSEDDIPFKGEVTMLKYNGHPDFTKIITNPSLDIVCFSKMVSQLCDDFYRIHLIVKTAYELRKKKMNVFIFADRRAYLDEIREELNRFNITNEIVEDIKSTRLVGGANAEEIKHAEIHANVILTTYQFMGTGKSIPKMDSIILTTPRKRKSRQYINRIFRLGSNYDITRKIIDIVDWSTPMKSQWYKRKSYYDEMKYPIKIKKVEYTELETEMLEMGIIKYETDNTKNLDEIENHINKLNNTDSIESSLQELENLIEKNLIL